MVARKKQSRGKCIYCGKEMAKGGITRHLSSCSQRQKFMAESIKKNGPEQQLYHLRIQDAWASDFWLNLEMNGSAKLNDLDRYLRAIWLECCGHLSEFFIGAAWSTKIAKKTRANQIFEPDVKLTHIYDFGTSSETLITVAAVRQGYPTTKHPIALMARNEPPEWTCMECDQPAKWLCVECMYEDETPGTLCDQHVKKHPHDAYGEPMLLINSPRMGMCGYEGPADPPY